MTADIPQEDKTCCRLDYRKKRQLIPHCLASLGRLSRQGGDITYSQEPILLIRAVMAAMCGCLQTANTPVFKKHMSALLQAYQPNTIFLLLLKKERSCCSLESMRLQTLI